jgi:hypothetical protein
MRTKSSAHACSHKQAFSNAELPRVLTEHLARRGQLGCVLGLTLLVTAAGAAGALIRTPADALWWARP